MTADDASPLCVDPKINKKKNRIFMGPQSTSQA